MTPDRYRQQPFVALGEAVGVLASRAIGGFLSRRAAESQRRGQLVAAAAERFGVLDDDEARARLAWIHRLGNRVVYEIEPAGDWSERSEFHYRALSAVVQLLEGTLPLQLLDRVDRPVLAFGDVGLELVRRRLAVIETTARAALAAAAETASPVDRLRLLHDAFRSIAWTAESGG